MKKFKQRSKRGQRRVLVCVGILLFVIVAFSFHVLNDRFFSELNSGQEVLDDENTVGESSDDETVSPTEMPPEAEVSLDWLYEIALEPTFCYGSNYHGIRLTESALDEIFDIDVLTCDEIPIDSVGLGDIAVCGSYVGICVGQYKDVLIFAYISPVSSEILPDGGVYLGSSMEQQDSTFYGMRPVPFERYYKVGAGNRPALDSRLSEKLVRVGESRRWYESYVYYYGRLMSGCRVDELVASFPEKLFTTTSLVVDKDEFLEFLEKFPAYAKSIFTDYSFFVTDEMDFDDYSVFKVSCISMSPDSLFETSGEWRISVYYTKEFVPFAAPQISKYTDLCGLIPENTEDVVLERTEEELSRDKIMFDAGYELQQDGTYIYHYNGYSVIVDPNRDIVGVSGDGTITEEVSSTEQLIFSDDIPEELVAILTEELKKIISDESEESTDEE